MRRRTRLSACRPVPVPCSSIAPFCCIDDRAASNSTYLARAPRPQLYRRVSLGIRSIVAEWSEVGSEGWCPMFGHVGRTAMQLIDMSPAIPKLVLVGRLHRPELDQQQHVVDGFQ